MPKARLHELYARGLGVIDEALVSFGDGFNVLTGETGAGKTLLLGALELSLGAESTSARYAVTTELMTTALFSTSDRGELVFSRESTPTGRLRATLNGAPSSAEMLRSAASDLIVIHGQHDSLTLRSRTEIVRLIDVAGGVDTGALDDVRTRLAAARGLRERYGGDPHRRERERELLEFQYRELVDAALEDEDELGAVLGELERLTSLREGQAALSALVEALDGDHDVALLSQFAQAIGSLPAGKDYEPARAQLLEALALSRDAVSQLASLTDPDLVDDAVIADLEARAGLLRELARKYGGTVHSAMVTRDELARQRDELDEAVNRLSSIDLEIAGLEALETELAREVRRAREYAAVQLTQAVRAQLPRVALANATLRFVVDGVDGSDAQILFTPNPGLPEGPLQSLASGGELSRVLLALSLETADGDVVAVFDEVDAGVGGQVAEQIGQCLAEVGSHQQVIAITHLASVAAKASHHFVIEKNVARGVTTTTVRHVHGEERVREIARMLVGDASSTEAQELARRLLDTH